MVARCRSPNHSDTKPARAWLWTTVAALASCAQPAVVASAGLAETTDALCANGLDDDGNGFADCDDLGCLLSSDVRVCLAEREADPIRCHDDRDNDGDDLKDCADPDCADADCIEATDATCSDGRDNDGDGLVDCEAFGCRGGCAVTVCAKGPLERDAAACQDGLDNDHDGQVDCDDEDCRRCAPGCGQAQAEAQGGAAACGDGIDNDGDRLVDCQDPDCLRVVGVSSCDTHAEATPERCNDGKDNDNDPYVDCADADCGGVGACQEIDAQRCGDGLDNDHDGLADCDDPGCNRFAACQENTDVSCQDGLDNDGDHVVDCADPSCWSGCGVRVCGGEKSQAACHDHADNDHDGLIDCADWDCLACDPECRALPKESTPELCQNNEDDDHDGVADCRDEDCAVLLLTDCGVGTEVCADGEDNDNDPYIDCDDWDCRGTPPCAEDPGERCDDGQDNDRDGFADCDDRDCRAFPRCQTRALETGTGACGDGQDNDGDGATDCADSECFGDPSIEVCPAPTMISLADLNDPRRPSFLALAPHAALRVAAGPAYVSTPVGADNTGLWSVWLQQALPAPDVDVRFSGVRVVLPPSHAGLWATVAPGARVEIRGLATTLHGEPVVRLGAVRALSGGRAVAPTPITTEALARAGREWLGVLVRVDDVEVVASAKNSARVGFAVVERGLRPVSTPLWIDVARASPAGDGVVGRRFGYLVGVVRRDLGEAVLMPRAEVDFGPATGAYVDSDGDGVIDGVEAVLGSDAWTVDSDGDGEPDFDEVQDPTAPLDRDCDGRPDVVESDVTDSDGDGVSDENDPDESDGPRADADNDGLDNAVDADDDNDGVCNLPAARHGRACVGVVKGTCVTLGDNCPTVANIEQQDRDGDGVGDACAQDRDHDRICEARAADPLGCVAVPGLCLCAPLGLADNCPDTANADQDNHDQDSLGDACDADDDQDGLCDPGVQEGSDGCGFAPAGVPARHPDNCAWTVNPDQADRDADGLGDACDLGGRAPASGELVLNEVLAKPEGLDANTDGWVEPWADQFVEVLNLAHARLDLSGCELWIDGELRVRLWGRPSRAAYALAPAQALLFFGGGVVRPAWFTADAAQPLVVVAGGSLALTAGGAQLAVRCPAQGGWQDIAEAVLPAALGGVSQNRVRDGDASAAWVAHDSLGPAKASPGRCVSGAALANCLGL